MGSFVEQAQAFLQQRFPRHVTAAFLGGSTATGAAGASSDLDIVIILGQPWQEVAYVETFLFGNRLVEAFVYGAAGLQQWRQQTRANGRPTVDRLIACGIALIDTPQARQLQASCQRALDDGPAPLSEQDMEQEVYRLSSLVDDLVDATDPGLEYAVGSALWRAAAELSLRRNRHWIGSGKWLLRELRDDDRYGLAAWASDPVRSSRGLIQAVHVLLDDCGGYHQDGMLRGERPAGL